MFSLCVLCVLCGESSAPPTRPSASYIFPAGGQRGTTVDVRVGGLFLHDKCGVRGRPAPASPRRRTSRPPSRIWFEGPVLPLPESQQQEDYPADMRGQGDGREGRAARAAAAVALFTSQGGGGRAGVRRRRAARGGREGDRRRRRSRSAIKLPVTANGRVFPREDIDLWEFDAEAGKTVTAFVHAAVDQLAARRRSSTSSTRTETWSRSRCCTRASGTDARVRFTPKAAGKYRVRITDARTLGGPAYVYRLTVTTDDVPEFHFPLKVPAGRAEGRDRRRRPHARRRSR